MHQTPTNQQPSIGQEAVRLMIVEDESIVAYDLLDILEDLGYCVVSLVGTGEEAIAVTRTVRPAAILMDVRLAGSLDGIEAAARIRGESDVPIVFLTAHSSPEFRQRAAALSPFGYLIKPFYAAELRSAIEVAIRRHRLRRDMAAAALSDDTADE